MERRELYRVCVRIASAFEQRGKSKSIAFAMKISNGWHIEINTDNGIHSKRMRIPGLLREIFRYHKTTQSAAAGLREQGPDLEYLDSARSLSRSNILGGLALVASFLAKVSKHKCD